MLRSVRRPSIRSTSLEEDPKVVLDELGKSILISWDTESDEVMSVIENSLACSPELGRLVLVGLARSVVIEPIPHGFDGTAGWWLTV